MHQLSPDDNMLEIEKGFLPLAKRSASRSRRSSAFPGFRDSRAAVTYLAKPQYQRVGGRCHFRRCRCRRERAQRVSPMTYLTAIHRLGKGIGLFHDIKKSTAEALDGILTDLEREGYRLLKSFRTPIISPIRNCSHGPTFSATPRKPRAITGPVARIAEVKRLRGRQRRCHAYRMDRP